LTSAKPPDTATGLISSPKIESARGVGDGPGVAVRVGVGGRLNAVGEGSGVGEEANEPGLDSSVGLRGAGFVSESGDGRVSGVVVGTWPGAGTGPEQATRSTRKPVNKRNG
jgi:hypothetical protein